MARKRTHLSEPEILKPAQVAKMIGVNQKTIARWADAGKLPCMKTPGGHRLFEKKAVEKFMKDMHMEVA